MFTPHAQVAADAALGLASYASTKVQHQSLQFLGSLCCAKQVGADAAHFKLESCRCEVEALRAELDKDAAGKLQGR